MSGSRPEKRHRRLRGNVDQPAEREDHTDHNTGEDTRREHSQECGHGDPEIEPGNAVQPPQLWDVDHPEHDRVDDDRRQHRLRQLREQRRQHDQGREYEGTRDEGRHRCPRPGRLVERAGRQAGRHRHSLKYAGSDVCHPLRHGLLIDVDAIPMPSRKRARITRGLREADQQQRQRRDHDHRQVLTDDVVVRKHRCRKPTRDVSDDRDAVGSQVEERRCQQSANDEHERARHRGHRETQREDHRQRDDPDQERRPVDVAQPAHP